MTKVELFEVMRREYFIHGKGIRRIAREQGVHRRLVRQAIVSALPAPGKVPEREAPVLTKPLQGVVDEWLRGDREAPRKQRHTGRRIFQRLQGEYGYRGAESTVCRYVGRKRREVGLLSGRAFVPQVHVPGEEGEVERKRIGLSHCVPTTSLRRNFVSQGKRGRMRKAVWKAAWAVFGARIWSRCPGLKAMKH